MKRVLGRYLFLLYIVTVVITGCTGRVGSGDGTKSVSERSAADTDAGSDKLRVAATLFPYYDFAKQIAGEQAELTLVVPAGMDSHSFEPTPADIHTILNADILLCNGGEMEHWLEAVLDSLEDSDITVVRMMDYVKPLEAEEHRPDETPDHAGHEEDLLYDEHIWTSPVNAIRLSEVIGAVLERKDSGHAEGYRKRTDAYTRELEKLDAGYRRLSEEKQRNLIVTGDKFPFRYLAKEYGFDYRAAFSGCSSDTEPSAKTIADLIDTVRREQIPAVYYLELKSPRVAEIIGEETGAKPLLLHSCHSVTRAQFEDGITYLELMEQNIKNLREGLVE